MIPSFWQWFRPAVQGHVLPACPAKSINSGLCRALSGSRMFRFSQWMFVLFIVFIAQPAAAANAEQAYAACEAVRQQSPTDPQQWGINYCNYYSELRYLDTQPPAYFLENSYWGTRYGSFRIDDTSCPNSLQTFDENVGRCVLAGDKGKNGGPDCGGDEKGSDVGNPCNAGTGNKTHTEVLFTGGDGVPELRLQYNSLVSENKRLGFGWTTAFHKRLVKWISCSSRTRNREKLPVHL